MVLDEERNVAVVGEQPYVALRLGVPVMTPVLLGNYLRPSLARAWMNMHQAKADSRCLGRWRA